MQKPASNSILVTKFLTLPRAAILICATLMALLGYSVIVTPNTLVVSPNGDIKGTINIIRAELQGQRFWREQQLKAKREFEWISSAPQRNANLNTRTVEIMEQHRQRMNDFYEKYPNSRPSSAEEKAQTLRDKADMIEQEEMEQTLNKARLNRLAKLEQTITFIQTHLPEKTQP